MTRLALDLALTGHRKHFAKRPTFVFGFVTVALVALGLGPAGCISTPSYPVMFSCDQEAAPQCPKTYSCLADGCCHRDGIDATATWGACSLFGNETSADTSSMESGSTTSNTSDEPSSLPPTNANE